MENNSLNNELSTPTTQQMLVTGLRKLAEFFEQNPDFPATEMVMAIYNYDTKEEAAQVAKVLGSSKKEYSDYSFTLVKEFSPYVKMRVVFSRGNICQRVVIGQKEIPEQIIPARPSEVIPAHKEDILAWDCGSILNEMTTEE